MMAGEELHQLETTCSLEDYRKPQGAERDLTVVMGLTGDLQGSLSLTMNQAAGLHWTKCLINIDSEDIDQTVVDAIGELGNMVVGGAKRRLQDFQLTMSLPSVIQASCNHLSYQSKTVPFWLRYQFGEYEITVVIALTDHVTA